MQGSQPSSLVYFQSRRVGVNTFALQPKILNYMSYKYILSYQPVKGTKLTYSVEGKIVGHLSGTCAMQHFRAREAICVRSKLRVTGFCHILEQLLFTQDFRNLTHVTAISFFLIAYHVTPSLLPPIEPAVILIDIQWCVVCLHRTMRIGQCYVIKLLYRPITSQHLQGSQILMSFCSCRGS